MRGKMAERLCSREHMMAYFNLKRARVKLLNKRHNLKENPRTTSEMFHIKYISRNNLNHISTQLPKQAMTV